MKTMRIGSAAKQMAIGSVSTVKPMSTDMAAGNAERAKLYGSARWRQARLRFLQEHPLCQRCAEQGVLRAAYAVDHVDGHAFRDWLERFWREDRWAPICRDCHAAKSAEELAEWRRMGEGAKEGHPTRGGVCFYSGLRNPPPHPFISEKILKF